MIKKLAILVPGIGLLLTACPGRAMDLKQARLTQVVNDVQIISAAEQRQKAASVNDIFAIPDVLRTGNASRAELVAQDETVTRVGANTIFSFEPANRTIDLKQGSLLFHSPHGKGGGTIHTSSATASVIGTTLIVTTTPNGGFKIIDLEGRVDIKLPNGHTVRIQPGQMIFVLPGGHHLSPVIIFRMDQLLQNSQLISGFNQPLTSLTLILQEVNHQLKLIKDGQFSDTGLRVGPDATKDQVLVIVDENSQPSGRHNPNQIPPDLAAAEKSDATINQPSLTDLSIPTPPNHVFTGKPFTVASPYFLGQNFSGFVANNININIPFIGEGGPYIDLTAYASLGRFDFVALNLFKIESSVNFYGLDPGDNLSLIGVQGFQISGDTSISLTTDAKNFLLASGPSLTLDNVTLANNSGNLAVFSGADLNIQSYSQLTGDQVNLVAGNSLNLNNTAISANTLVLTAGDGILLNAGGQPMTASAQNASASFTAPNLISVANADFSSYSSVNMAANTINLINVNFGAGSSEVFSTRDGILAPHPNTGQASVPGALNFINNVTHHIDGEFKHLIPAHFKLT